MQTISRVTLKRVSKRFDAVRALVDVNLDIAPGDVVAVMGANGAGKSTLLKLLALLARPTRGALTFNDDDEPDREALRRRIGLLSHEPLVYPDLTARENLEFFARLTGVAPPGDRANELVSLFGMTEFADSRPTRVLSRGQRQRVSLARALVGSPDLLLLDEPAAGLDHRAVGRIESTIVDLKKRGGMAVVVTHETELAAAIATRAVIIHRGKIVMDDIAPSGADAWRGLYLDAIDGSTV